jgi:hypothetical protein
MGDNALIWLDARKRAIVTFEQWQRRALSANAASGASMHVVAET